MARTLVPRRKKRISQQVRSSLGLGMLLAVLTGANVYYFFLRQDTSVQRLMRPVSTSRALGESKKEALAESIPPSLLGAAYKEKKPEKPTAALPPPAGMGFDDGSVLGQFGPSDTLSEVLAREDFGTDAGRVIAALTKQVDPKMIRAGERYQVERDEAGAPERFEYVPTPVLRYLVTRGEDGSWQVERQEKPLQIKTAQALGTIDYSLYESVAKAGEAPALVSLIVDMYAWDINFFTDTRPGDTWKVVVEKQYLGDRFYKYGRLLAAEYNGKNGTFRGFYWNPGGKPGEGRYYDEKGQALAKSMLKTPLRFVRISSKFNPRRFHPILHRFKAHLGVDYAAPVGTPVWAPSAGKVVQADFQKGSGNTIVIVHSNKLVTKYYHLSRFAKGLKVGKHVAQKEVIGYVGTTGLSTGPHLHFSMIKNGKYVDPAGQGVQRDPPVANKKAYLQAIKPRLAALKALAPVVAKNQ
ncbi:MAG: peptidoglycan DD-metalloendopeptidase family protein [Deltaproteobacteria bacterium]|nr:peptidoglycan DD-metalloendopeptidase family protein [Deltaproteobacteria bacterium]